MTKYYGKDFSAEGYSNKAGVNPVGADDTGATDSTSFFPQDEKININSGTYSVDLESVNVQNLSGDGLVSYNGAVATTPPSELTGLSSKRVLHEFDTRFPSYDDALALSSPSTSLFPQALEMLNDRIYIAYGGSFTMWVVVYDAATFEELTAFKVSDNFGEGIAVYEDGGSTFLVSRYLVSGQGDKVAKFDVTILPANLSSPTPVQILDRDPGSFIFTDGNYIYVQEQYNKGGIQRRNKFSVFEKDFTFVCFKTFNERDIGSIDSASTQPKTQNINIIGGQFYATYGTLYETGDIVKNHLQNGIRVFSDMCQEVDSFMVNGDLFISSLQGNGYTVDFIEYEGITEYNGVPISLIVTQGPDNGFGAGGLLLIEEGSPRGIDFSSSRSVMGDATDNLFGKGNIEHDNDGIKDPVTGDLLSSIIPLLDWMYNSGTSVTEIYTSGSTITDVNSDLIPQGVFIEIKTGNFFSFNMVQTTAGSTTRWWITRQSQGNYTQTLVT